MSASITEFAENGGRRNRSFSVRGITVLISPGSANDIEARALADSLAAHAAGVDFRWTALEKERDHAVAAAHKAHEQMLLAERKVPPADPVRLLGVGCVRFNEKGEMFLLNQRKHGWASFAILVDGWDDLFRRYNAKVIAHGTDEAGAWWEVR